MGLRKDVGTLLIVGLGSTELTSLEQAWLRLIQPSGIILFRRNIESAAQVHALLKSTSAIVGTQHFRCIDAEGGLVDRLRDLVAPMPSAATVAATASKKLARQHGRLIGEELALLGLNTTFAPVLDLALPASADVMKTRAAGPTARSVIGYAEPFLKGLRDAGILGCGKHFPGLGGGTLDSHATMPEIDRDWMQLWNEDMLPYRKLHRELPFIMVSHAAYPRLESSPGPASVSKFWIADVLKRRLGYRGLILSDDLEMGGVLGSRSIEEAAIAAIAAGTHIIEICHEPALMLRAYEALLSEGEHSSSFRRNVERAAAHVRKAKRRCLPKDGLSEPATTDQLDQIRQRVARLNSEIQKVQFKSKSDQ